MELPHIGQACVVCNRNDYLPFKCSHCYKTVCVDHKADHGSECPLNQTNFKLDNNKQPSESLKKACDFCKKITLKLELVECAFCKGNHCLYHRHQVQHECPELAKSHEARKKEDEARIVRQKEALMKLKSLGQKSPDTQTSQPVISREYQDRAGLFKARNRLAMAKRIRVMRIKHTARGPPNILDEDKIYFEIKFLHEPLSSLSAATKAGSCIRIFTTAKHTIGRMVDWAADELRLTNKNHIANADQLVFKKYMDNNNETIMLDNQVNFKYYLDSCQLEDGDELLITYARAK